MSIFSHKKGDQKGLENKLIILISFAFMAIELRRQNEQLSIQRRDPYGLYLCSRGRFVLGFESRALRFDNWCHLARIDDGSG
jgi:hypothetical protein